MRNGHQVLLFISKLYLLNPISQCESFQMALRGSCGMRSSDSTEDIWNEDKYLPEMCFPTPGRVSLISLNSICCYLNLFCYVKSSLSASQQFSPLLLLRIWMKNPNKRLMRHGTTTLRISSRFSDFSKQFSGLKWPKWFVYIWQYRIKKEKWFLKISFNCKEANSEKNFL